VFFFYFKPIRAEFGEIINKIGKYNEEFGEIISKIGKNRNFTCIDTESVPADEVLG